MLIMVNVEVKAVFFLILSGKCRLSVSVDGSLTVFWLVTVGGDADESLGHVATEIDRDTGRAERRSAASECCGERSGIGWPVFGWLVWGELGEEFVCGTGPVAGGMGELLERCGDRGFFDEVARESAGKGLVAGEAVRAEDLVGCSEDACPVGHPLELAHLDGGKDPKNICGEGENSAEQSRM